MKDKKKKKIEYYKETKKILRNENAAIFIMDPELITAMNKNINGYVFYPLSFTNFAKISIGD